MSLSKRAGRFQEMLDGRGYALEVLELPDSTHTADDAARALGCSKAQIVKSLVFRDTDTGGPVMVLASGTNRVDETKIAAVLGRDIARADAAYVKRTTGFSIGGVPPLGHKQTMLLFVDEDLLQYDEVWAAAGTPNAVFRIPGKITTILDPHTVLPIT
ncbi:YbaK/EbsC family protein [Frankia sp. AgPm24]|uniref:YbaK/EbsC family protein n=1 Tax=Frankia sp. AgPm24 TaxID=631128 RepID=UPI00200DE3C0|nr:YbaK/EbsC family protein [Frankia sp. AgPm24]MCK9923468.1 YbaK/EbsC family protein [Frankia sp. AgPm24]